MSPCASPVCHAWLIQQTDPDHPIEVGSGVPRSWDHWEVGSPVNHRENGGFMGFDGILWDITMI